MNELKEEDKIKLMNDVADVLEKLLTNLITHREDNSLAEIMQLIETYTAKKELEARIDERLVIRELLNNIHYKYPDDDANSDRLFRNDFMNVFSEYMDETTNLISQLQSQLTNNKEGIEK